MSHRRPDHFSRTLKPASRRSSPTVRRPPTTESGRKTTVVLQRHPSRKDARETKRSAIRRTAPQTSPRHTPQPHTHTHTSSRCLGKEGKGGNPRHSLSRLIRFFSVLLLLLSSPPPEKLGEERRQTTTADHGVRGCHPSFLDEIPAKQPGRGKFLSDVTAGVSRKGTSGQETEKRMRLEDAKLSRYSSSSKTGMARDMQKAQGGPASGAEGAATS